MLGALLVTFTQLDQPSLLAGALVTAPAVSVVLGPLAGMIGATAGLLIGRGSSGPAEPPPFTEEPGVGRDAPRRSGPGPFSALTRLATGAIWFAIGLHWACDASQNFFYGLGVNSPRTTIRCSTWSFAATSPRKVGGSLVVKIGVVITARLFARLREQAGTDCEQVELEGATVADVYRALRMRHPGLEADMQLIRPARNQSFADWEEQVADGDEVAFIPPVSGGAGAAALIELTAEPLDARRLEAAVVDPGAGAICTFTGIVRDNSRGERVTHLEYEAYGGMAERQMQAIVDEIAERWPEARVAMAHRTGSLEIGEASVIVSVSCPHRAEAIAACKWGIDRLKESVPIWKKEFAHSGAVWIEGADARPGA